jgi:plastocyanin
LLLAGTSVISCSDKNKSASGSTDNDAKAPVEEEEASACLGRKKGPVVELQAGKAGGDALARVRWYPHNLRLPAGRFVTIRITNPSSTPHNFAAESLDCETGLFRTGEMVMVSFKVPPGETDFVCPIHDAFMTGNFIGKP